MRRVSAAVGSIGDASRFTRVVLVPQSGGAPQSVQDRASNRFAILERGPNHDDVQDTRGSEIGGVAHFAEAVNESGTKSVPGIDRRTRRRLSLVWRADIRDPVLESYQAETPGSQDQR